MINLSKEEALTLWNKDIGHQSYAYDFSGRKIKRDDYNVENEVGWVVELINPNAPQSEGNVMIMHRRTALDKGDSYPKFSIDFKNFIIERDIKWDFYYIEEELEDED